MHDGNRPGRQGPHSVDPAAITRDLRRTPSAHSGGGGLWRADDAGDETVVLPAMPASAQSADARDGETGSGTEHDDDPRSAAGPRPGRRGVTRRTLFAAGGLAIVGAGAVAAWSASGASPQAGGPLPSPGGSQGSASAGGTVSAVPVDVSSSSPASPPPPYVPNPGGSVNGGQVQSAPEYYVSAGPKVVALTIDDGPSGQYTPQILKLLQKYEIIATFCMIGRQIGPNKAVVAEVVQAGHMIVNHTWDHADQTKLSAAAVASEISRTNDAFADLGLYPSVFRAPYGSWNKTVFAACAAADLRPLDWSVDPKDWSMPGVQTIVSNIMKNTKTGSIILEHDGGGDRSQTVAALGIVLPQLLEQGYRFTTV
ncbi:MAG TPA: polysaccharide deacetylase family protein [Actinocrinis sp.]